MKIITLALLSVAVLSGCAHKFHNMEGLKSDPQASSIILQEDYESRDNEAWRYTLPAGRYTPVNESKHGFFYESNSPLQLVDLYTPRTPNFGGIYWEKSEPSPTGIYYSENELFFYTVKDEQIKSLITIKK